MGALWTGHPCPAAHVERMDGAWHRLHSHRMGGLRAGCPRHVAARLRPQAVGALWTGHPCPAAHVVKMNGAWHRLHSHRMGASARGTQSRPAARRGSHAAQSRPGAKHGRYKAMDSCPLQSTAGLMDSPLGIGSANLQTWPNRDGYLGAGAGVGGGGAWVVAGGVVAAALILAMYLAGSLSNFLTQSLQQSFTSWPS